MTVTAPLIFDALRTPRGRGKATGALHSVKPIDLAGGVIRAMLERHPSVDPGRIDDLVLGVVSPVGEQGGNIARTASIVAGLPDTVRVRDASKAAAESAGGRWEPHPAEAVIDRMLTEFGRPGRMGEPPEFLVDLGRKGSSLVAAFGDSAGRS